MNTEFIKDTVAKDTVIFFYDTTKRFSQYFGTLLSEEHFLPEEEKVSLLNSFNVSSDGIRRRAAYIIKGEKPSADIISFGKAGDVLLVIANKQCDINDAVMSAKALNMRVVILSKASLAGLECIVYEKDSEVIDLCGELINALCNAADTKEAAPFPIPLCGASSGCFKKEIDEDMFVSYKEAGITHMEISFGRYEDTVDLNFKEYKRLADKHGITLWSYHLPFMPFNTLNPAHFDETVRNFTVGYLKELMKEAQQEAGIKLFVIHPSGEPIHEDDRKASMKQVKKSLAELAVFADENGMTLAVENLPRTCLGRSTEDMFELLSAHPSLKMCLDVNHAGSERAPDIIKRVGNKIITVHISDYMGGDECHLMPEEGITDWTATIRELKKAGYNGPFMYEISKGTEEDGAIWAKEAWHTKLFIRERFLSYSDVRENYEKLMNKAK